MLFNIFVDDMGIQLNNSMTINSLLYADDEVIIHESEDEFPLRILQL